MQEASPQMTGAALQPGVGHGFIPDYKFSLAPHLSSLRSARMHTHTHTHHATRACTADLVVVLSLDSGTTA